MPAGSAYHPRRNAGVIATSGRAENSSNECTRITGGDPEAIRPHPSRRRSNAGSMGGAPLGFGVAEICLRPGEASRLTRDAVRLDGGGEAR